MSSTSVIAGTAPYIDEDTVLVKVGKTWVDALVLHAAANTPPLPHAQRGPWRLTVLTSGLERRVEIVGHDGVGFNVRPAPPEEAA